MKENSNGTDTNVGRMENSIQEDIKIVEKLINTMKSDRTMFEEDKSKEIYTFFINSLENILSDHKRGLKEDEEKDKIIDLMSEQLTTPIHDKRWVKEYFERKAKEVE